MNGTNEKPVETICHICLMILDSSAIHYISIEWRRSHYYYYSYYSSYYIVPRSSSRAGTAAAPYGNGFLLFTIQSSLRMISYASPRI